MSPKYQHVIDEIERRIASGEWPSGTRLPPRRQLVAELQTSKHAVDMAMMILTRTGVLRGQQGDATYVV